MRRPEQARVSDTETVARWRAELVDQLGPDLRESVRHCHHSDGGALVVLLRALRHCGAGDALLQGVALYWRELTAQQRGQSIPYGGV